MGITRPGRGGAAAQPLAVHVGALELEIVEHVAVRRGLLLPEISCYGGTPRRAHHDVLILAPRGRRPGRPAMVYALVGETTCCSAAAGVVCAEVRLVRSAKAPESNSCVWPCAAVARRRISRGSDLQLLAVEHGGPESVGLALDGTTSAPERRAQRPRLAAPCTMACRGRMPSPSSATAGSRPTDRLTRRARQSARRRIRGASSIKFLSRDDRLYQLQLRGRSSARLPNPNLLARLRAAGYVCRRPFYTQEFDR